MSPELGAKLIAEAKSHVGAHYIHGGYGATPGRSDGFPCTPPRAVEFIFDAHHMDPQKQSDPRQDIAIAAASTTISHFVEENGKQVKKTKYSVCAGNYRTGFGVDNVSPYDKEVADLIAFLKKAEQMQHTPVLSGLTPRRAYGPGPIGGDIGGKLVMGQQCAGIRHFDCVGFISYCVWRATGKAMQLEIKLWREPFNSGGRVHDLRTTDKPSELMDGDVLIKDTHHIGFVSKDGTLIQAEDTDIGVRATPGFSLSRPGGWTHLVRLPDYRPDP